MSDFIVHFIALGMMIAIIILYSLSLYANTFLLADSALLKVKRQTMHRGVRGSKIVSGTE